jgi:hypothetical protein
MDAADVLYGVSMGGDGVTKVVSRRLPREVAEDGGEVEAREAEVEPPPPFAGMAEDEADEDAAEESASSGLIGEQPPAVSPGPRGSVEAA